MTDTLPSGRRWRLWFVRDLALGVIVPSTLGGFGSVHQLLDLCSHFRCQYLALLALFAILLWRAKSPRWAAITGLACLHNAVLIVPYSLPVKSESTAAPTISVISFNVHTSNRQSGDVLEYLQRQEADVVLLIEVDNRWIRELQPLSDSYPHRVIAADDNNFGIALFSRFPILRQELLGLGTDYSISIWAELDVADRTIGFLGTHPYPPMSPQLFRLRNEQLASVADKVKSAGLPTIVAGDFNATPWCVGFRPLHAAGLTDSALGRGVQPTWNSHIPLLRIPIDHVLLTKEFTTLRRTVGPNCGSDHYAVVAVLGLSSERGPRGP